MTPLLDTITSLSTRQICGVAILGTFVILIGWSLLAKSIRETEGDERDENQEGGRDE